MPNSTTKRAAKRKPAARQPSATGDALRLRAFRLITDPRVDLDTRDALLNSATNGDGDLAELVRRAESGEIILDATQDDGEPTPSTPRDLAELIAALLAHPALPTELYNDIAESLCDMSSDINYHTPGMIARALDARARREAARKGGER